MRNSLYSILRTGCKFTDLKTSKNGLTVYVGAIIILNAQRTLYCMENVIIRMGLGIHRKYINLYKSKALILLYFSLVLSRSLNLKS